MIIKSIGNGRNSVLRANPHLHGFFRSLHISLLGSPCPHILRLALNAAARVRGEIMKSLYIKNRMYQTFTGHAQSEPAAFANIKLLALLGTPRGTISY